MTLSFSRSNLRAPRWCSVIALALASPLLSNSNLSAQTLQDLSFGTDATFEVLTWNIEHFPKNGSATVSMVGQVIEALDVDVLALQEIDDRVEFQQMIDGLPEYTAFYASSFFAGLAYVYKHDRVVIQNIYEIYTTQPFWSTFPRSPVVMELSYDGEDVVVINNHFKCCGDGFLDLGDSGDEETRRLGASNLLKQYVEQNFPNKRVLIVGDLNDLLTDVPAHNVFQGFLNEPANYQFADMAIASGGSFNWSFPNWPSHLDHLLMSNELFAEFASPEAAVETIRIDNFLSGGFAQYDTNISDHRPVALKLPIGSGCSNNVTAIETVRFGAPPNPWVLRRGLTSGPVIGSTWDPFIDHTVFAPAATLDVLIVSAQGTINVPSASGTLLCPIPGPDFFFYGIPSGAPFAVAIPDDCGLAGLAVCSQGASLGGGPLQVTNALDLVLGTQ